MSVSLFLEQQTTLHVTTMPAILDLCFNKLWAHCLLTAIRKSQLFFADVLESNWAMRHQPPARLFQQLSVVQQKVSVTAAAGIQLSR